MTIGEFIKRNLKAGKSAQETLASTQQVFKGCSTTLKSVYFYSSQLKREGGFSGLAKTNQADPKALENALALLDGQTKPKAKRVRKAKAVKVEAPAEMPVAA